ncbi:ABC transporter ATP-binding protein/permease [Acuticoccus sp. MNP-M23]|uniref:ABCB family ABC transporter ATP-binding protein/permease n=1 Tax=Acuticoccus sp. MNP-M23 TaxID=3072793 RepID=UPI002815DD88|nr:ABC transporter ATP-binding protein/permease [Acuticoccus sp. MNP-M23]WMS42321.1 ABC transporter ATP-binding protein/permease [Acuticoccus sp. MNP-M23]
MADEPKQISAERGKMLSALRNLWPYMWPTGRPDLKLRVGLALLAMVVAKIITVLIPYTYKWATDALTVGEFGTAGPASGNGLELPAYVVGPVMLVIAYGVGRITMMAFNQLRDGLFAKVGQHAVRQLARRTFVHLHALSLRYHLQRRTGGLSRVIERGVKGIETLVRFTILNSIPTVLEFILVAAVVAYQFSFSYVGVIAAIVVVYVWFTVRASQWRIAIRREMNESDTDANSKAVDSLINYETVKYFNNEQMETDRFDRSMARYEDAAIRTWTSLSWLNIGQTVIFTVGLTTLMVMSAKAVMAGEQTLGDFVMVNALLMQLSIPLNFIGFVYREIKQALADIETMFGILQLPAEVVDKPGAPPLDVPQGNVRFDNVVFHYDPERPILHGIDFEVPAGTTLAIVGPSGAGKSTISRLLYRFYDVAGGAIRIDGQDIRDVSQDSLRRMIGIVPQDTVLFNDSIAYNIAYGRPGATDAQVQRAAEMAQIGDFIRALPNGFATEVGERGLKLSGGEKQRVAIARTILKAPPILILDEATSALDTRTEEEIQTALDEVAQGRTTLLIAHRLSTVVNADQIIVVEAGRIVERGTHQALVDKGGLYHEMWERQRRDAEALPGPQDEPERILSVREREERS